MISFAIIHPGGERKEVQSVYIASTYVQIMWGLSGAYDLNLKANTLTARSQKAQRKGKCLWKAEDIAAVRKQVNDYLAVGNDDMKKELRQAVTRHSATMPK